ncbi:hypothetical protein XENOCAPTIV_006912 [Xenoophorus captivus]|uniref:ADF-H domain-containing protein n=1 Tax=Xenoophorus captivus TaxID=1517983 RepID=A0ABV0Q8H0_9TELE
MATQIDKEACREAYNQVRDDNTETNWAEMIQIQSRRGSWLSLGFSCRLIIVTVSWLTGAYLSCKFERYHHKLELFGFLWSAGWRTVRRDDGRLFGFVRFTTGDAMSKRAKFTLITWIGENVSGLQRAKISTDKTLVKDVVQVRDSGEVSVKLTVPLGETGPYWNFAKEFMISDPRELEEEYLRMELKKAGGANYDAQAE